jgi:hypothetical protein
MIKRGSTIESLLMLCALADPQEASKWLYNLLGAEVCPLSSAGNTIIGRRAWDAFPYRATEYMGMPDSSRADRARWAIVYAADKLDGYDLDIRAALLAMFPSKEME